MSDVKRIPESHCLNCGAKLNMLGTGDSTEANPQPGDVTVCIQCGGVMMLSDDLTPRGMSGEEMDHLASDLEWMDDVAKMVARVNFVRRIQ